jgi:predicted secreted protein
MRKLLFTIVGASLLSVGLSVPSLAQGAQPAPQQAAKPAPDPNEIVCEKQQDTGSRLTAHKVCQTRGEWAEQRRMNRLDVEKAQTARDLSH